jgi:hypothetical protein
VRLINKAAKENVELPHAKQRKSFKSLLGRGRISAMAVPFAESIFAAWYLMMTGPGRKSPAATLTPCNPMAGQNLILSISESVRASPRRS